MVSWKILKYHSRYYCQIPLQVMLLPILILHSESSTGENLPGHQCRKVSSSKDKWTPRYRYQTGWCQELRSQQQLPVFAPSHMKPPNRSQSWLFHHMQQIRWRTPWIPQPAELNHEIMKIFKFTTVATSQVSLTPSQYFLLILIIIEQYTSLSFCSTRAKNPHWDSSR